MDDYKKIQFQHIARSQPVNADLTAKYETVPIYTVNSYDWVGLFKVGWSNHKQKITYAWAQSQPKENGDGCVGEVTFHRPVIKEDIHDFYQVVYFNKDNKLQGASSVFQFRVPQDIELVEEELSDDSDMLFITSRQSQLETKLSQVENELSESKRRLRAVEVDRAQTIEKMKKHKEEQENTVIMNHELQVKFERIENEFRESQLDCQGKTAEIEKLEEKIKILTNELEGLQEQMAERTENEKKLRNERDALKGQMDRLEEEACMYRNHLTTANNSKQQYQEETETLRREISELKVVHESNRMSVAEGQSNYEKELQARQKDLEAAVDKAVKMEMEAASLKDKLEATEARKAVYEMEMISASDTIKHLSTTVEQLNTKLDIQKHEFEKEITKMQQSSEEVVKEMSMENNRLLSTIGKLKHERETLTREAEPSNDHGVALQLALSQMKDDLGQTEQKLKTCMEEKKQIAQSEKAAGRQVRQLEEGIASWRQKYDTLLVLHEAKPIEVDNEATANTTNLDMLTRSELQSMAQDLSSELEMKNQKKEKYKLKYVDEKQRAAAMRDYYETKLLELQNSLQLAEISVDMKSKQLKVTGAPQIEPITHQVHDLPEPLVPTRVSTSSDDKAPVDGSDSAAKSTFAGEPLACDSAASASIASAVVDSDAGEASEEENEAYEEEEMKFHDAPEEAPAVMKCDQCKHIFPTTATETDRVWHIAQNHMSEPIPLDLTQSPHPISQILPPPVNTASQASIQQPNSRPKPPPTKPQQNLRGGSRVPPPIPDRVKTVQAVAQPQAVALPQSVTYPPVVMPPRSVAYPLPQAVTSRISYPAPQPIRERPISRQPQQQTLTIYTCPVCHKTFDTIFFTRQHFEVHVNGHFSD